LAPRKKARRNKAPGKKSASKSRRAKAGTARAAATAATEAAWNKATGKTSPTTRKKAVKKATPKKAAAKTTTAKKATRKKAAPRKAAPAKKAAAKKAAPRRARRKTASRGKGRSAHIAVKRDAMDQSALLGELEALASMMDAHGLFEVSYELDSDGSKRIHVSRNGAPMLAAAAQVAPAPSFEAAPAPAAAAPGAPAPTAPAIDEGLVPFASPMVGTFYRAPSPEASAFVAVGDQVEAGSVVCIIEAMKVMNEINPEISGEIVSIEVENGEAVEFGQTLMLLRPR
jgi:acetyl-CoA carboxylase biotin carboxyl carrier protein